jgi:hypothetical protein
MKCRRTVLIALGVSMVLATGVCWSQNEAEYGNNLSVPVVFAEGYGIGGQPTSTSNGLRGQMGAFNINGVTPATCFDTAGNPVTGCYLQQTAADWQAEWVNGAPATTEASGRKPGEAVIVNWSDNLISQRWTPQAPVRVEVVLYQNLAETPTFTRQMDSFNMLFNSGKGSTEMWGTTGSKSPSSYRTVFSTNARLKIEKFNSDGTFDEATTKACGFNGAIWEAYGQDGPGFYAAEINVSGNLIYGFNWDLNKCDATVNKPEGKWRLTFMLDPEATALDGVTKVEPNVVFAKLDPADITVDDDERAPYATPVLQNGSTSYMDIQIVAPKGGGRAGSSGRTETEYGNNLAVPAVFAEGYGLTGEFTGTNNGLRGQAGAFNANGITSTVNCYDANNISVPGCYLQQTAADWQAQTADGMPAHFDANSNRVRGEDVVVNWSDNLISQRWTPGAPVRIEVVLYQNKNESFPTFGNSMMGYNMFYNSGKGSTEMWGTNTSTYMSDYRTVFSINARLKLEKPGDPTTTAACGFNGAIWEAFNKDGPGNYVAEVNVSGNLIYGFNWMLNQCDTTTGANPVGKWRLTFSLDPLAKDLIGNPVLPNVRLASLDPADLTSTDGERAPYAIPVLLDDSTSVMDIEIVNARGGGSSRRPR